MRRFFLALSLGLALAACGGAPRIHAHHDPALDALFTQLEAAPDTASSARIEAQIERFAPGFTDLVLARNTRTAVQEEAMNPNYVGGDIACGAQTLRQVLARLVQGAGFAQVEEVGDGEEALANDFSEAEGLKALTL